MMLQLIIKRNHVDGEEDDNEDYAGIMKTMMKMEGSHLSLL